MLLYKITPRAHVTNKIVEVHLYKPFPGSLISRFVREKLLTIKLARESLWELKPECKLIISSPGLNFFRSKKNIFPYLYKSCQIANLLEISNYRNGIKFLSLTIPKI